MSSCARPVVVALACLVAVTGCGDPASDGERSASGSSGGRSGADESTAPGPGTTIPDDFPLSAGLGGPEDTIATSRTGTGLRDLELCGTSPLRGLGVRDRMVAAATGGESADTRELVLLGDAHQAAAVAEEMTGLAATCEPGARGGMETRTDVLGSPFAPPPAATLLQTYTVDGEPGTGATVVHVVPVGAAVLLASTYGRWTREESRQAVDRTVPPLRETVSALEVFDDPATTGGGPTTDPAGTGEVGTGGRAAWPDSGDGSIGATQRLPASAPGPGLHDDREQLTRVAAARVVVQTYGEDSLASLGEADEATRTTGKNVPAMCVFTRTGC